MRKIIGPDVSFYQDDNSTPQGINFVRMNQLTDFVIIRAGQHLGADPDFRENWRRAKEAGLPRGSYWFYDSRADPRQQANLWFDLLAGDFGELPLFADLEESYGGPFTGWPHWKTFLERIKALVGSKEVGIYTAFYYWRDNAPNPNTQPSELEYFHRYSLWIANYGTDQPMVPRPWSPNEWLFWQFTASGDGLHYGVESFEIDLNYFNGDAQAFAQRFNVPVPEDPIPPEDPVGNRYRVSAGSLYVRQGPGTSFPSIGFLVRNDIVEVLAANPDGAWYRIRRLSDGLTGWSASAYLQKITSPPPPPPPPPPGDGDQYRVSAGSLNVREGPGTNFRVIGSFQLNNIVEELEANSDRTWLQVRRLTDGLTGWSSAAYLVRITPPPPPPPPSGQKYRVTATRLHVRAGPGTQFQSLGYVELNEIVTEISANADQTWREIRRSDGLTGWSFARYLVPYVIPTPDPNEPPQNVDGDWYQVTGARLNTREGPGVNYASKGFLVKDEGVQAIETSDDQAWIRFRRVDGFNAWAAVSGLKKLGKSPSAVMQKLFKGVTYYRDEKSRPRKVVSHVLVIDKNMAGMRFLVTPPLRDTLPQLCTRTTSGFLRDQGMQIAINGDGFHYLDPDQFNPQEYCPRGGDPVRLIGFAASRGKVYSQGEPGHPILYINQRNDISFDKPTGKIFNAIAGDRMLVAKGKKVSGLNKTALHPRTAFGVNQNGRWVYLMVVDGRETSDGATFDELADMLLAYGVYAGTAFDGGGSSTMVVEGVDGRPRVLNTLVDQGVPGKERAVANHLGIAFKK
ncbi:MAG TPA: SH3 domain-containing protein [Anaerolineales bacterium]|nr:SH3 domain-containing protein [Anaerolineales bacterium]